MSDFANPEKAYAWLDGDAFRFPAGSEMPEDVYADKFDDGLPYGGIEAGFELTTEQSVTKKKVFNYRKSAYKVLRDALDQGMKFRAVDNSEATLKTRLQGGTITKVGQNHVVEIGVGEEFALLVRLDDGEDKTAFWCERVTLSGPATRAAIDGQSIDGWEFNITYLSPLQEVIPALPGGMKIDGETTSSSEG